ncbi:MAG: carbon-nitrogen hydrolase family protein [Sphingomonadales bacterium]|nr:carbon-nitrogen hydrolase family protein [Sphingomonadales bacterium]
MKICVIQMNSQDDKDANLAQARSLLQEALEATKPDIVVLPELFTYLGGTVDGAKQAAETVPDGPAFEMLQNAATNHGVFVYGGSMAERDGDKYYNTTLVFDPSGTLIARYRKIHMFDVVTPDGKVFHESATYTPGEEIVTFDMAGIAVGATICYDLRFPELYISLVKAGAKLIFAPAAFTLMTGKDHWEVLCRARAIESQCYLVAPNQTGPYVEDGVERASCGNSMIVDPWGTVIGRARDGVGFFAAELDFAYQDRVRGDLPSLKNRVLS